MFSKLIGGGVCERTFINVYGCVGREGDPVARFELAVRLKRIVYGGPFKTKTTCSNLHG